MDQLQSSSGSGRNAYPGIVIAFGDTKWFKCSICRDSHVGQSREDAEKKSHPYICSSENDGDDHSSSENPNHVFNANSHQLDSTEVDVKPDVGISKGSENSRNESQQHLIEETEVKSDLGIHRSPSLRTKAKRHRVKGIAPTRIQPRRSKTTGDLQTLIKPVAQETISTRLKKNRNTRKVDRSRPSQNRVQPQRMAKTKGRKCLGEREKKPTSNSKKVQRRFSLRLKAKRILKKSTGWQQRTNSMKLSKVKKMKKFHCVRCSSKFSTRGQLVVHGRIHTGYRPYICNRCKKSFCQLTNLNNHIRVHTGERPFKCQFCNKCFKQVTTKVFHERIHTDEKPYKCQLCKKKFRQIANLNKHKGTHTWGV